MLDGLGLTVHVSPAHDELISIRAPGLHSVDGFVERRSVLARSPTFAAFFTSPHYLPGVEMMLWLLKDDSTIFAIALQYLRQMDCFRTPNLDRYDISDQVYVGAQLYFLAKRLQLSKLEDHAYEILSMIQNSLSTAEIIDLATVIYERKDEKDNRIRGFLQRQVEKNLRALLNDYKWRHLLRHARSTLAADMFELVSTILLEGEANDYPPTLPAPERGSMITLKPDEDLCAVIIRSVRMPELSDLVAARGQRLTGCQVVGRDIVGTDEVGDRCIVPRDYVELTIDDKDDDAKEQLQLPIIHETLPPSRRSHRRPLSFSCASTDPHDVVHGVGSRSKASWLLGMVSSIPESGGSSLGSTTPSRGPVKSVSLGGRSTAWRWGRHN